MWKILDLLLILVPWLIELMRKRRPVGEKASDYVRKVQNEKLETTKLVLEQKGDELSRLSRSRLAITRELLARVRKQGTKPPV